MKAHEERVVAERNDLDTKLGKLAQFIEFNGEFTKLKEVEQVLLRRQYVIMCDYRSVLDQRIDLFLPSVQ